MNETLSEEQVHELRQAFSAVDFNGDGFIDAKDLPRVFSHFNENSQAFVVEEEELQRLMEQCDMDSAGRISFHQFLILIAVKMNLTDTVEELVEAFRMFDRGNSGYISFDDLWRVMQNLGENPSRHDIEDMMREADRDGDGKINFAEFVEMVRCHEQGNKTEPQ